MSNLKPRSIAVAGCCYQDKPPSAPEVERFALSFLASPDFEICWTKITSGPAGAGYHTWTVELWIPPKVPR